MPELKFGAVTVQLFMSPEKKQYQYKIYDGEFADILSGSWPVLLGVIRQANKLGDNIPKKV